MFRDDTGAVSAMRVAFLGFIAPVMLIWSGLSIRHGKLEEIPAGVQMVILGLAGAKVCQAKFAE